MFLVLLLAFFPGHSFGFGRVYGVGATLTALSSGSGVTPIHVPSASEKKIPVTVLSGCLGSGKTSFLQHIIRNNENSKQKFGLVVNDMAAVNVDSKLIKAQTLGSFDGIDTLDLQNGCVCCTLADDLMSSVSRLVGLSNAKGVDYDHIIVECSGIAEPRKIRELFQEAEDIGSSLVCGFRLDTLVTVVEANVFLNMYGSADADIATNLQFVVRSDDQEGQRAIEADGTGDRRITDLLLEQVECADIVLINKCDMLSSPTDQLPLVKKIVASINPTARVFTCVRGVVEGTNPINLLGSARGEGAASWGILDEHRKLVESIKLVGCSDPACTDPSHSHDHSHSHSHSHAGATTAEERFGITSFVYQRRRPFHPARFSMFLQSLGQLSVDGISELSSVRTSSQQENDQQHSLPTARRSLLRSKGFVWMGTSSSAAYFMSHAGQYLELIVLGRWWADIPKIEWPSGSEGEITLDFDGKHGDRRQELVFIGQFDEMGNKGGNSRKALEEVLDSCLLTDDEMVLYEDIVYSSGGDNALRTTFFSTT